MREERGRLRAEKREREREIIFWSHRRRRPSASTQGKSDVGFRVIETKRVLKKSDNYLKWTQIGILIKIKELFRGRGIHQL